MNQSIMNDMERRKFEESFKDAFKDAGVQPSERVWTNIELDLIKAEGEKMKRRIFFYQMLAAASISFAVIITGVGLYALKENRAQIAMTEHNGNTTGNAGKDSPAGIQNGDNKDELASSDGIGNHSPGENGNPADENQDNQNSASRPGSEDLTETGIQPSNERRIANALTDNDRLPKTSSDNAGETSDNASKHGDQSSYDIASGDHSESHEAAGPEMKADSEGLDSRSTSPVLRTQNADQNANEATSSGRTIGAAEMDRSSVAQRNLPRVYEAREPELVFADEKTVEADPVALMFARLNDLEKELAKAGSEKERSASREKLWTSVGFAAGAFNAINSGQAAPQSNTLLTFANNSAVQNQTRASGVAYSMGISMGTQVSERWVVQGGVTYLTEMSDYTSTQAVQESGTFKAASVNQFRSASNLDVNEKFIPTAPYTVNNSNEYLSIPLQAGYILVKKKVQWQLNAGVSTDLFLQNTVDPEGNIAKTTSDAGDDSPFRTVNFSGLIGSEVSYRFSDHYRIGLNPGLRYPLNSIYKDNLGLESSPLTFDIGLRFRYIFK